MNTLTREQKFQMDMLTLSDLLTTEELIVFEREYKDRYLYPERFLEESERFPQESHPKPVKQTNPEPDAIKRRKWEECRRERMNSIKRDDDSEEEILSEIAELEGLWWDRFEATY